jgi:hypothetical protein
MPVIRPVVILTAEGAVASAGGLVVYKRRRSGVDRWLAFVDLGDAARRLGPERYHVLEAGWVAVMSSRKRRGRVTRCPAEGLQEVVAKDHT